MLAADLRPEPNGLHIFVMKQFLLATVLATTLSGVGIAQTTPLYENYGLVTGSPTIDATAFANYGTFNVSGTLPFDFTNTRFFTNRGFMSSLPGFRFDTAFDLGAPQPAAVFVNENGAEVRSLDTTAITGTTFSGQILSPSYLLISADTIVNHGNLVTGAAGLLRLTGNNIDLSRGGLGIGRLEVTSTHFVTESNYFPDPAIYDAYWGGMTNQDMDVGGLLQVSRSATNVTSPVHDVTNSALFSFSFPQLLALENPISSVYTNTGGADPETGRITNILVQAAFVALSDTNLGAAIKWAPSDDLSNPFQTAIIEISLPETNTVTGDLESATLYLKDTLASSTNYAFLANLAAFPTTFVPATYELTRQPPFEFITGADGNGSVTNTLFFNPADTNFVPVVTNFYAAYSARVDSLASQPPQVPGFEVTDNPGRIEIYADNLNMSRTRFRGTGLISINTSNLVGSRNVLVDSENVVYNLAVPAGNLEVSGIGRERVVRLNGSLSAYSAVFTNFFGTMMTNSVDDGTGTGTMTNVVTNVVTEIDYHVLIVDATPLQATKPVITHDFITHADSVVLSDPMTVVRQLLIDADSFTLNSRLTYTTGDFGSTNAPRLRTFESKGNFEINDVAVFGTDRPNPYESFANRGFLAANGLLFSATAFENSGTITSRVDGIVIQSQTAQFENATTHSARGLEITATDMRFTASTNATVGALILNVTGSLSDTGEGANNVFITRNGFHLRTKPAFGDLLGTRIETIAPRFARVEHTWAGEDRGTSASGFQDNVAIGHLVLGGDRDVQLAFRGAGGANAMYVDLLELTGSLTNALAAGDLESALEIDPSLTIYFANSNVSAEQLEELSNGRLRRVEFAGTSNFVDVPVRSGGNSVQMERVVRESTTVDSDGDGTVNAYDAYPLDFDGTLMLTGRRANSETSITLSWQAEPNATYQVEYTTSLKAPSWQLLSTFTNPASAAQTATVQDRLTGDHAQRYYRLRAGE